MLQENPNKNNQEKDLSQSTSKVFGKFQIRGGRFEKGIFYSLLIVVVALIPFSIWLFDNNLQDSFFLDEDEINLNSSVTNSSSLATDTNTAVLPQLENLRELDTDEDGLNDYDELYRYKTSPYIQDSDSDGRADNIEVEEDTDPNCPEGVVCDRTAFATNTETETESNESTGSDEIDVTNLSVEELRRIMIDAGAPEDQVYQIPEEDLRATYEEILAQEGVDVDTDSGQIPSEDSTGLSDLIEEEEGGSDSILSNLDYETLFNLPPGDIRQLLIEGGVPADELAEIDDETLVQVYQQSLYENFSELNSQQ